MARKRERSGRGRGRGGERGGRGVRTRPGTPKSMVDKGAAPGAETECMRFPARSVFVKYFVLCKSQRSIVPNGAAKVFEGEGEECDNRL